METAESKSTLGELKHYKHKFKKYMRNDDYSKLDSALDHLKYMSVEPRHLEATRIARKVKKLAKRQGIIGQKARDLLEQWNGSGLLSNYHEQCASEMSSDEETMESWTVVSSNSGHLEENLERDIKPCEESASIDIYKRYASAIKANSSSAVSNDEIYDAIKQRRGSVNSDRQLRSSEDTTNRKRKFDSKNFVTSQSAEMEMQPVPEHPWDLGAKTMISAKISANFMPLTGYQKTSEYGQVMPSNTSPKRPRKGKENKTFNMEKKRTSGPKKQKPTPLMRKVLRMKKACFR